MGTVYRAYDRSSGAVVALKLLHKAVSSADETTRFAREAQILSELRHDAIVSHVAHGQTLAGQHFLAMEWLDGNDLAQRLLRGPLTLPAAILVVRRAAAALQVAHQRGIVHRDLKPTNLFLPGDEIARCKLLDFGIARPLTEIPLTHTGVVVGTPEYMSPEQARGSRELTPATDIFSLGCVLYECLSGVPPFLGAHVAAVLVRILFEAPAPITDRRPGVPPALVSLLADMMNKDTDQRIANAEVLLSRLSDLGEVAEPLIVQTLAAPRTPAPAFAENEQLLFSLVVAAVPKPDLLLATPPPPLPADAAPRESILYAARMLGVRAEYLLDGTLIATVPQLESARDQVSLAARVALLIKDRWPAATVAVTTGRGTARGATAIGEVADRAGRILAQQTGAPMAERGESGVWLDEMSGRLLDHHFTVSHKTQWTLLTGEVKEVDASRPLLGKPTPCVGRDAELGILESLLTSCLSESMARVIIVSALPGIGKSRLRHEFLRRVEKNPGAVTTLLGRGDMMNATAAYGILGAAVRRLCGIIDGEPLAEQQHKLRTRIAQHVPTAEQERVVLFVGELCKVPFPAADAPVLQAARREPKVMRDCLRRAALDWLRAECAAAPVLLVLDDLQWGDALTVSLLDEALQELHAAPLMVLAFARPEINKVFPELWQNRQPQQITLRSLSKKACERLIKQVLGQDVPAEAVAHAVEQSAGNVLFLEELIRAIADGSWTQQNATLIAMLQARLGRLDSSVRRAVRAAAVFGQTFWRGGVAAILDAGQPVAETETWIAVLVEAELVQKQLASSIKADVEYRFRHALVRDAAYDLLTPNDLQLGHRIAGDFLAAAAADAGIIADHFVRSGDRSRAAIFYAQAAEEALACYDLRCAIDKAKRGIECGAQGESRGRLLGIQCITHLWTLNLLAVPEYGEAAIPLLPLQSRRYVETANSLLMVIYSGVPVTTALPAERIVATLLETPPTPETVAPLAEAAAWLCATASYTTNHHVVVAAYARLTELCAQTAADNLSVQRWLSWGTCNYLYFRNPLPWTLYTTAQHGAQQFRQVGDHLYQAIIQLFLGFYLYELGELTAGEDHLVAQWVKIQSGPVSMLNGLAAQLIGMLLFRSLAPHDEPRLKRARAAAQELLFNTIADLPDNISYGNMVRARIHSCEGRMEQAIEDAMRGYEMPKTSWPCHRLAAAGLLRLLGEQGQHSQARTIALHELQSLADHSELEFFALQLRSECVNVLYQAGDSERAVIELQATLAQLRPRVADIPQPAQRRVYLTNNADCAHIRKLSVALLGTDPIAELMGVV